MWTIFVVVSTQIPNLCPGVVKAQFRNNSLEIAILFFELPQALALRGHQSGIPLASVVKRLLPRSPPSNTFPLPACHPQLAFNEKAIYASLNFDLFMKRSISPPQHHHWKIPHKNGRNKQEDFIRKRTLNLNHFTRYNSSLMDHF